MSKPRSNHRERECASCGKGFMGTATKCYPCRAIERECISCGTKFKGAHRKCAPCQSVKRTCLTCDAAFKGKHAQCFACRATDRACISCGRSFLAAGGKNLCTGCLSDDRECLSCGKTFNGTNLTCTACRWAALSKVERAARERARSNARRARKQAAQVSGPVAASVYAAIREEGPCVYCAEPAEVVDHVIPLARGGWEHEDNLVPACKPCNLAKHSKLLGEWDPVRVEHAVLVSTKVADIHFANQIGAL